MNKKTSKAINEFIQKNAHLSDETLSLKIESRYKVKVSKDAIRKRRASLGLPSFTNTGEELPPAERIKADIAKKADKSKLKDVSSAYDQALEKINEYEKDIEAWKAKSGAVFPISKPISTNTSEATAVVLMSDVHVEELVRRAWVNGKNEYNLDIAKTRVIEFFQNTVKLLQKEQVAVKIDTMVLWLGGDFITGNIHDENVETSQLLPIEAMLFAEQLLKSGIDFLLKNTNVSFVIPCNTGNHSRITKKQRHSTDVGNSLETIMYYHLSEYFRNEKRVRFVLQEGYHVILPIYDNYRIRFHHGQNIKYGGGIGGLYIPAKKAISQWQKSDPVQLDCFGHLHSLKIDTDFICNGSIIGYSPFAVAIKADFERPQQCFFLVDKKRGRTGVFPITFSV